MSQAIDQAGEARLSPPRLLALVALFVPVAAAQLPLALYLPTLYATTYGLSLGAIGLVFLIGRTWDALSDPLIGTLSDATRTRFGRRRPWIAAGCLLFAVTTAQLFFPVGQPTPLSLGVTLFFFYLSWTMIQLPLYAWMGEISGRYHERTRIVAYGHAVSAVSLLFVILLPALVDLLGPNQDRLKLGVMGGFILLTLVPAALLTLCVGREPPLPTAHARRAPLGDVMRTIFGNMLLLRILASDFAVTVGQSVRASLFLFFVTFYLGKPALGGVLFLTQVALGVLVAPIWLKIGLRVGKHRAVVAGELVQVGINLCLLLVAPGSIALMFVLVVAQGLAQASGNLMLRAIVADVADEHRLNSGEDRTGLMFSVFSLSGKLGTAFAIGVALPLVGYFGFDPKGVNSPSALLALKLVFALGPALTHALSALVVMSFPLDERRQEAIRAALAQRDAQASARVEPAAGSRVQAPAQDQLAGDLR